MSYGGVYGGATYPPASTGNNLAQASIYVITGNTLDSAASADQAVFVTAKTNIQLASPVPEYTTERWAVSASELKLISLSPEPHDVKVIVSGKLKSNSVVNDGRVVIRLNSTDGVGTGTTKTYATGPTAGGTTVEAGFTVIGFFRSLENQTISLEVAKNFAGTLILESVLVEVTPLW